MEEPLVQLSPAQRNRLPMFPLPGVWLFPGALLPLHVFEPRYVEMVEYALATADGALAIGTLRPGYEEDYEGRPPVYPLLGAGVILAANDREDGRYDIVVRGLERVRLMREHPPERSFREAMVARHPDHTSPDDPLEHRLRDLLHQLAERSPGAQQALQLILGQAEDAAELTNLVGMHAISDPQLKQALFENPDVHARLQLACEAMGRLLLELHTAPPGTWH